MIITVSSFWGQPLQNAQRFEKGPQNKMNNVSFPDCCVKKQNAEALYALLRSADSLLSFGESYEKKKYLICICLLSPGLIGVFPSTLI